MKNVDIEPSFFEGNRKNLAKLLKPDSIAVINSNDIMPSNADGLMRFKQNSDLFYLTGILQEDTILVLFPDAKQRIGREVLFIRDYNPDIEVWEGKKLSPEEARKISGIETVFELSRFEHTFHDMVFNAENIYLNSNEHNRAKDEVESRDKRFIKHCKSLYPLHHYYRVAPLLHNLRVIKNETEIELTRQACDLTEKGFRRVLQFVKPGVNEYEIGAELAHEFMRNGFNFADYEPIIASGENSCFLHYEKNNRFCEDGDILLLDAGACYSLYNADMTRTIPVNGRYTGRQKQIYSSVLRALKGTIAEMKPGKKLKDIQTVTRELIAKELLDLGLVKPEDVKNMINKSPDFKKYYPHDVSHFLGLSVHDVGSFDIELKPGMILTCEPGIYIREEKLGVRLENDILITESGNEDLMKNIPIEADEIEEIMNSSI